MQIVYFVVDLADLVAVVATQKVRPDSLLCHPLEPRRAHAVDVGGQLSVAIDDLVGLLLDDLEAVAFLHGAQVTSFRREDLGHFGI